MRQSTKIDGDKANSDAAPRGSNQSGMRAYNERLVLTLIRQNGAMAKAEIARRTGLSAQTVSVIMRALEAEGLLSRGEPVRGRIGQPSIPMGLAQDGAFFFGLKVGRRSLDLVLTDFLGEVQHRLRTSHPYPTPDNTIRFTTQAIAEITEKLPPEHRSRIAGLGVALPFQLWDWADTQDLDAAVMRGWKTRDIATEIGTKSDFPVFVCNDASTACGAELVFGNQNNPRDFLYFFVGFFIGGGLVLDNSLYTGRTGNAAALGSIMVPTPDGQMRQLVDVARQEMADSTAGSVMIIEDEAIIAMDIESIVAEMGHRITGVARTRDEAVALGKSDPPDLILADIQLADNSSGIDAVNDLLDALGARPVIFITAFPERLLTGQKPEPAFLISKPYSVDQVVSAVSQAMFFSSTETLNG